MNEEKILEGNKLFAEFICYNKFDSQHGQKDGLPNFEDYYTIKEVPLNNDDMDCYTIYDLKFDTSWDWLMRVVEKIETLEVPDFLESSFGGTINTDIEVAYDVCLEFVRWYNNKSK